MMRNEFSGQFVVAIFPLIRQPLVQACREVLTIAALRLRQTVCRLAEFVRMGDLRAGRERQQRQKSWVDPYGRCAKRRNYVRWCVNAETQIPPRGALHDPATLESSWGYLLLVKADRPDAGNMDTCAVRRFECIRKGNAAEPVASSFELRLPRELFIAPLPGDVCGIQHALQGMTRNAQLFAMISQQIMKGLRAVIDTVFGISFNLAYGPIPDASQVPQPRIKLMGLCGSEPQFQLSLDHATPVFGFRCIA